MIRFHLGLGSNLGDRAGNLGRAVQLLRETPGIRVTRVSSLWETEPWGPIPQPPFLNGALCGRTSHPPRALLEICLRIEALLGRVRRHRWGPRVVDLDLLLMEGIVLDQPGLTLPHPELTIRPFVLRPLAEISPEVRHPILGSTVAELLARCDRPFRMRPWHPEGAVAGTGGGRAPC